MSQVIRTALILVAVFAVAALSITLINTLVPFIAVLVPQFSTALSAVTPYFLQARQLINWLVGVPTLVDFCLMCTYTFPFIRASISIVSKVYKLIVG